RDDLAENRGGLGSDGRCPGGRPALDGADAPRDPGHGAGRMAVARGRDRGKWAGETIVSGERPSGLRLTPQAIVAILIILFGLLKTADNLGWVEAAAFLRLWPLALVAIGVVMFLRAADRPGRFSGGLVTLLGLWLSGGRILGWRVSIAALWPL